MNEEFGSQDRHGGLAFVVKAQLLSADDVSRAMKRMAHEIIERNQGVVDLTVVGLQRGGVAIAGQLGEYLNAFSGEYVPVAALDVSFYRDDIDQRPLRDAASTTIAGDLTGRTIVLVDDVLFTGRTVRSALLALSDWGRPAKVELAVLVDRGHRELPLRPDYVGKNLPTARDESVRASLEGVWIGTKVAS
jgi:pyrimidine operon attenuation protein/uracil phosphoribosyltransferase